MYAALHQRASGTSLRHVAGPCYILHPSVSHRRQQEERRADGKLEKVVPRIQQTRGEGKTKQ
jgi:hypothetical protein